MAGGDDGGGQDGDSGSDYGELIQRLHAELSASGDAWQPRAHELVRARLRRPEEFLVWARRNHHFSFTMAEVLITVRNKPAELAQQLLVTILGELREERSLFGGEEALAP